MPSVRTALAPLTLVFLAAACADTQPVATSTPAPTRQSGSTVTMPSMEGPPATTQPVSPSIVAESVVDAPMVVQPVAQTVLTGADVLVRDGFAQLRGMRIGLIANHTTASGGTHLADLMHGRSDVTLVALFGPEHGVRGDADAGAKIADGRDTRTGLPAYSLYGPNRAPTDAQMEGLDALVFDVQDVGSRFYTFISTMGLSMQSAARKGIPFVVLDRPNPLGGDYIGGFTLLPAQRSFVGQFEIPQAHGLTVGELAQVLKGQRLVSGLENLDLRIVKMEGWRRGELWPETQLAWPMPSPNIPTFETALVYAGTCLIEGTSASEGRGTRTPFLRLGAPWANGERLAASLNARNLPGVRFRAAAFTPVSIAGMSAEPKLKDTPVQGIDIEVTNAQAVQPVELGVYVTHAFMEQAPDRAGFFDRAAFFDKLTGSPRLREMLVAGSTPEAVIAAYTPDVARFRAARAPYLLY